MLAFSHHLAVRTAKLALQNHRLLSDMSHRGFWVFLNRVCTPDSPWRFFSSLLHLTNNFPAFCCITLVTHPTDARFSKEFSSFLDLLKKGEVSDGILYLFPFFFTLSLSAWTEAHHYLCGSTQLTCSLLSWEPAEIFVRNACSNEHNIFFSSVWGSPCGFHQEMCYQWERSPQLLKGEGQKGLPPPGSFKGPCRHRG